MDVHPRGKRLATVLLGLVLIAVSALWWHRREPSRLSPAAEALLLDAPAAEGSAAASPLPADAAPAAQGPSPQGAGPPSDYGPPPVLAGGRGEGRAEIAVHVTGAVLHPGVYVLAEGRRVVDALLRAGGPAPDGRPDLVNLAARLEDGQRVYIPSEKDARVLASGGLPQGATPWEAATLTPAGGPAGGRSGKVNPNRAGVGELDALPGIGPGLAQRIVDYRKAHGPFRRLEDLQQVSGIGPSKLEQLKGYVTLD